MERIKKDFLKNWWKFLSVILILYSLIFGLTIEIPDLPVVRESIRNLFYHVPMWFTMIVILFVSLFFSIKYLNKNIKKYDIIAAESVKTGLLFGVLGITTGAIWAKFTWGVFWISDPKLNGAALAVLSYFAYLILRNSVKDNDKKARIAAVYNIFAYVMMIVFMIIIPKLSDMSIHPGSSNQSFFTIAELNYKLRLVFYPAIIGWILFAFWILKIRVKLAKINEIID